MRTLRMLLLLLALQTLAGLSACASVPTDAEAYPNQTDLTDADLGSVFPPVTALCRDGWISYSEHRSGTCLGHSGVREWYHEAGWLRVASIDGPVTRAEINHIESQLHMPPGAGSLESYSRFYAASIEEGHRVIRGEFVRGDPRWLLEHRTILESPSSNVFIVDKDNLPYVRDGGCGVVTVTFDARSATVAQPVCNGDA